MNCRNKIGKLKTLNDTLALFLLLSFSLFTVSTDDNLAIVVVAMALLKTSIFLNQCNFSPLFAPFCSSH